MKTIGATIEFPVTTDWTQNGAGTIDSSNYKTVSTITSCFHSSSTSAFYVPFNYFF